MIIIVELMKKDLKKLFFIELNTMKISENQSNQWLNISCVSYVSWSETKKP